MLQWSFVLKVDKNNSGIIREYIENGDKSFNEKKYGIFANGRY
jgi:hypothetical protein